MKRKCCCSRHFGLVCHLGILLFHTFENLRPGVGLSSILRQRRLNSISDLCYIFASCRKATSRLTSGCWPTGRGLPSTHPPSHPSMVHSGGCVGTVRGVSIWGHFRRSQIAQVNSQQKKYNIDVNSFSCCYHFFEIEVEMDLDR